MDWYPWFIKDFRRDTLHLSLAEEGAYRRLIDQYMEQREALIDDDAALARLLGVGLEEWRAVAGKVRPFFRIKDGKLSHKRCDCELRAQDQRISRNSKRGQKAAFARWSKPKGLHAQALLTHATLNKDTSITSSFSVTGEESGLGEIARIAKRKGWTA
jgi:uncharacterized protein YdaU (DUF1376 family)